MPGDLGPVTWTGCADPKDAAAGGSRQAGRDGRACRAGQASRDGRASPFRAAAGEPAATAADAVRQGSGVSGTDAAGAGRDAAAPQSACPCGMPVPRSPAPMVSEGPDVEAARDVRPAAAASRARSDPRCAAAVTEALRVRSADGSRQRAAVRQAAAPATAPAVQQARPQPAALRRQRRRFRRLPVRPEQAAPRPRRRRRPGQQSPRVARPRARVPSLRAQPSGCPAVRRGPWLSPTCPPTGRRRRARPGESPWRP